MGRDRTAESRHQPRSVGNWVLFVFSIQHALISYLLASLAMLLWLAHSPRFEGAGILSVQWRRWFAKRFPYSTTLVRTIFWGPGFRKMNPDAPDTELDEPHERHERVHIRQFEDGAVQGFFIGMIVAGCMWRLGCEREEALVIWELIWLLFPIGIVFNWATALLRWRLPPKKRGGTRRSWWSRAYEVAYRDSEHERSAYAQTDRYLHEDHWTSWSEKQDEHRG